MSVITKTASGNDIYVSVSDTLGFLNVYGDSRAELEGLIKDCIAEMKKFLTPRACYREYEIKKEGEMLDLGFVKTKSLDLADRLEGCERIILIAATVGIGADRAVAKYSVTEPSRALIMQAAASAAVESWLDIICAELSEKMKLRERFSCGYGDLELTLQTEIFKALLCERHIGLTLGSSYLMSPTKSVTAIIGIE